MSLKETYSGEEGTRFEPEVEEGNIEYKRMFGKLDKQRFIKLRSQMLWRMDEGMRKSGIPEAIYLIGIEDNGEVSGLNVEELNSSIEKFKQIVKASEAEIVSKNIHCEKVGSFARIVIRKNSKLVTARELKIGLLGQLGSGKSTLLSVMSYGYLDDGQGSARSSIFRYNHEFKNGLTSSIAYEIVGYSNGNLVNRSSGFVGSWESIVSNSDTVVTFVDLPGSEKYYKTTLFGLMAHRPSYVIFVISGTEEMESKVFSQIELCERLGIGFIFVITKTDLGVEENLTKLNTVMGDRLETIERVIDPEYLNLMIETRKVPLIKVSNVTGHNHEILHSVINSIPTETRKRKTNSGHVEFMINQVFYISDVGIVVMGILFSGRIRVKDSLLIGPFDKAFYDVSIESIHKKQMPKKELIENETGCLFIKINDSDFVVNKHMMILSDELFKNLSNEFSVELDNIFATGLKEGMQVMAFSLNVSEPVRILELTVGEQKTVLKVCFLKDIMRYIKHEESIVIKHENILVVGTCLN